MRENWIEKKFGDPDLMQIIDGDRGKNYPQQSDFTSEGHCIFLNTKNVRPDGFNFDVLMFINKEKDEHLRKGKLNRRDVILTTRGTIGNIAIYDDSVEFDHIRINSGMLILRPNERTIASDFLFKILLSPIIKSQIVRHTSGAAQPQLPIKTLVDFIIPVPPIDEQKRIVSIVDQAFEAIDVAIENTKQNLANARELFESYLNAIFTQKGDRDEKKMGDTQIIQIIDGDRGKNYPQQSDFLVEGHCLFLNTKNVRPDGFNFDTTMFISKDKDDQLRKGKLNRRDVLLTTRGTIGNIAIYDDSVEFDHIRINSGMLILRPNESILKSEYLFELMRSSIMKSQIKRFTSGAAQPQLPIKTLVNFILPIPKKLEDQVQIVSSLNEIYSETQRLEAIYRQKLAALTELKQSILQKAFTGELTADQETP